MYIECAELQKQIILAGFIKKSLLKHSLTGFSSFAALFRKYADILQFSLRLHQGTTLISIVIGKPELVFDIFGGVGSSCFWN